MLHLVVDLGQQDERLRLLEAVTVSNKMQTVRFRFQRHQHSSLNLTSSHVFTGVLLKYAAVPKHKICDIQLLFVFFFV